MVSEVNEIIDRWKLSNPVRCHTLGLHEFDGQLPNYSSEAVLSRISEINQDLVKLDNFFTSEKFNDFEIGLIKTSLRLELFELDKNKEFTRSPIIWLRPLSLIETSYLARPYDTLDNRLLSIIAIEKQIPAYLDLMINKLDQPLSEPKLTMAISFLTGVLGFFNDKLISFVIKSDDEEIINNWSKVNIIAIKKLKEILKILNDEFLPNSIQDFALGEKNFKELLKYTENIDIPIDRLLEIGVEDLEKNFCALEKIGEEFGGLNKLLDSLYADTPQPENLVEEASSILLSTRQFILDQNLLNIVSDELCQVLPTPVYARNFGFAAMNAPGPFEKPEACKSYYWITPPETTWPMEKRNEYMKFFNRPFLHIVTIHEAYPGHYVQLLYDQQSKSEISKIFSNSTTMREGWGHYTEAMVIEEGYSPIDPHKLRTAQLLAALQRNVRYICAIKMHCRGMTVDDAINMFEEKAFLPRPNAEIEAHRGTVDPLFLNYTLGKLMIIKLRKDYELENPDTYTLAKFHNEFLSYGSPSIVELRKIMLQSDSGEILL